MQLENCTPGRKVWARFGTSGWRPATVVRTMNTEPVKIKLRFESGARTGGEREPADLRPRDPEKLGADRPPRDLAVRLADEQAKRQQRRVSSGHY